MTRAVSGARRAFCSARESKHLPLLRWAAQIQLLPFERLCSFGARLFVRQDEIDVADAQCAGEFKQGYDSWITAAALQVTDILLREAGRFGEFLLREALLLTQSCEIPPDQLAHVHTRNLRLYIL